MVFVPSSVMAHGPIVPCERQVSAIVYLARGLASTAGARKAQKSDREACAGDTLETVDEWRWYRGSADQFAQDAWRPRLPSDAVVAAAGFLLARRAASATRQQQVRLERQRSCSSAVSGGVFIRQKT